MPQIFFRSSPYLDSFGPIWVVRSYSNMEVIEKKLKALFGFFNGENLDFGSIWATQNHLLQQGKFWLCAIISLFLQDFATYSTDKPNFDQRLKFLHQMRVFIKVCLWDSNDHYSWHLVIGSIKLNLVVPICSLLCMVYNIVTIV